MVKSINRFINEELYNKSGIEVMFTKTFSFQDELRLKIGLSDSVEWFQPLIKGGFVDSDQE